MLGNRSTISISFSRTMFINCTTQTLNLHNLLFVPHHEKTLILVKKLCKDNNVSVKFHSTSFSRKDQATQTILLIEGNENGLYNHENGPDLEIGSSSCLSGTPNNLNS